MPPQRKVDDAIKLVPGVAPIANKFYKKIFKENVELKNSIKRFVKEWIH